MKRNSSNTLVKTIIFVLFVALTCVIFFGLMEGSKDEMNYTAFGLILFAEFVVYITSVISGINKTKRLNGSDITSFGVLYFITNIITNLFCFTSIGSLKTLIIINAIEVIIFMILLCVVVMKKNNN